MRRREGLILPLSAVSPTWSEEIMMWGPIASIGISSTPLGFAFVYGGERPGTSVNSDRWHPFQAVEHHNPIKFRLQFPPTIPNGPEC